MKLGVSYNVFDGEELLQYSLQGVRSQAAHIVVVYQMKSNFGQPASGDLLRTLTEIHEIGLVDELVEYKPVGKTGHTNELAKRNLGLERCRVAGCTHHMSMDYDEMYQTQQLAYAKYAVDDCDSSACMMQTYYKLPTMALDPPETYYVPLIYKIDDRQYRLSHQWPVTADPTRKMEPRKMKLFKRDEIEMHHMSYVRRDLMSKLVNSSASVNFRNRVGEIYGKWKEWKPGDKALLAGREERWYNLKEVHNLFNIDI